MYLNYNIQLQKYLLSYINSKKLGNLIAVLVRNKNLLVIDIHIVSSVSAQKLKCPSLAQLGKFQLELITTVDRPSMWRMLYQIVSDTSKDKATYVKSAYKTRLLFR